VNVGVLLLAAGASRRFGSDKRRAVLGDGRTLLATCIDTIRASDLPCLVCLGGGDTGLAGELADQGIAVALCPDAARGMGHTLATGMRRCPPDWEGVLVALADMPWIEASSYREIARQLTADTIVVPWCDGVRGNPVGFGREFFGLLEQQQGDRGARDVIARFPEAVRAVALDDPGIGRDADTPEALSSTTARD